MKRQIDGINWKAVLGTALCLILQIGCNSSKTPHPQNPKKADYAQCFRNTGTVRFVGTETAPLFFAVGPFEHKGHYYFSDFYGHQLLAYDGDGRLIQTTGGKGQGPGEFQMPYGLAFGPDDRMYVNDRGNMRTQVLDAQGAFLEFIDMQAIGESLLVYHQGEHTYLRYLGLISCETGTCLIQQLNLQTGEKTIFASADKTVAVSTWLWAQDPTNGDMFLANVMRPEVEVYDLEGRLLRTLSPAAPDWASMDRTGLHDPPRNGEELVKNVKARNERPHTTVNALGVLGDALLIQFTRHNMESEGYIMMIIDKMSGDTRQFGIITPGQLAEIRGETVSFAANEKDKGMGEVTLTHAAFVTDRGQH